MAELFRRVASLVAENVLPIHDADDVLAVAYLHLSLSLLVGRQEVFELPLLLGRDLCQKGGGDTYCAS